MSIKDIFNGASQMDGQNCSVRTEAEAVAKTQAEFEKIWKAVTDGHWPKPETPELPADKMAVAIFMGSRSSGGYAIKITDVKTEGGKLVVEYSKASPEPGMMSTNVMTEPFSIRLVDKTDAPVEFKDTTPRPKRPDFKDIRPF